MSNFNQQEWKNKKLDSFRINMKAQLSKELNIENPDDFIDALSGEYNATMDEIEWNIFNLRLKKLQL